MSFLDWTLLLVWLGVTLSGFWEGAVRLVFGGGGLVLGIGLAVLAGPEAEAALAELVGIPWLAAALARLVLIVVCLLLCLVAGWGIERTLKALHLKWVNRLCGAVLAGAAGALLLAMFLGAAIRLSPTWQEWSDGSLLAPRLVRLLDWAVSSQEAASSSTPSPEEPEPEAIER